MDIEPSLNEKRTALVAGEAIGVVARFAVMKYVAWLILGAIAYVFFMVVAIVNGNAIGWLMLLFLVLLVVVFCSGIYSSMRQSEQDHEDKLELLDILDKYRDQPGKMAAAIEDLERRQRERYA